MKIGLFGHGKMGQLVEKLAIEKGDEIVPFIEADVVIDFSHSSVVLDHLTLCLEHQKPLVIGTTGWDSLQSQAKEMVLNSQGACLYSPNFSIGVFLFSKIIRETASLFNQFPDYSVKGIETHHEKKQDSPSGTAKMLQQILLEEIPRLGDFNFKSIRQGSTPGTHQVIFDSAIDTIEITHTAHSRIGFALGALTAAEWLISKKGFFYLEDIFS